MKGKNRKPRRAPRPVPVAVEVNEDESCCGVCAEPALGCACQPCSFCGEVIDFGGNCACLGLNADEVL
jgi:hypothetical protein